MLVAEYTVSHGHDHPQRVSAYYEHAAEFEDYIYPMDPQNIKHFERKENIAVNVYALTDSGAIDPLCISDLLPTEVTMHVDLLLIEKHYVLIRNLSRLVRSQVTSREHAHYVCRRCLHFCTSAEILEKHMERCK